MDTKITFFDRVAGEIENVRKTPLVREINTFMTTPKGVMLIALLTVLAHIFSLEIVLYIMTLLYCIYVCVLGDDFLTLAPFCVFCYIAPSRVNNPGRSDESLFSGGTGLFLIIGVILLLVCFLLRVSFDRQMGFKRLLQSKRALLWGFLALGAAFLLSGIFSDHYSDIWGKNIGFGALEFVAVFLFYFLLTGLVDWTKVRKDYFAWIAFLAGCVIAIEVFHLYAFHFQDFFLDLPDGNRWNRWQIYLGWGMHNNIGAMLSVTIPFAFYLASRHKHSYAFVFSAVGMMVALLMTLSRTSILVGLAAFAISFVIMLVKSPKRKFLLIMGGGILAVGIVLLIILRDDLFSVVKNVFNNGLWDPSGRGSLYIKGLEVFVNNPIFGEGFYPTDMTTFSNAYWLIGSDMTSFLPPRWHNTIVQLLASCGLFGLLTYCLHRLQTVIMFVRDITLEKIFIAIALAAFLGMSLLDNHFFNLGPTLFYSVALAFAEKSKDQKEVGDGSRAN